MAELRIDELNINQPFKERSEPYAKYFGIMRLSKRQIRERILLAEELEDIFFEFLLLMEILHDNGRGYEQAQEQLETQYRDKMFEVLPEYDGDFIRDYAAAYAVNAVDTTARHIENLTKPVNIDVSSSGKPKVKAAGLSKKQAEKIRREVEGEVGDTLSPKTPIATEQEAENQPESNQADSWYISIDRAKFNAENEANTVLNRDDFLKAKEAGYTRKRWLTEHDNRVRPTHQEVEGVTVPIDGVFIVGDSVFGYPRDLTYSPNPSEVINCRCACSYLR